jgi:hypothetical protein
MLSFRSHRIVHADVCHGALRNRGIFDVAHGRKVVGEQVRGQKGLMLGCGRSPIIIGLHSAKVEALLVQQFTMRFVNRHNALYGQGGGGVVYFV